MFPDNASAWYGRILHALPRDVPIYLVGGAVRDHLLKRTSHDWDLITPGNAIEIARHVARKNDAAFYVLNEEFGAARVILKEEDRGGSSGRMVVDFTVLRAPSVEEDLRLRDFTINSIAIDFRDPQRILDPLHGLNDLTQKQIRVCSPTSFRDDPIRILRGVRHATELGFQLTSETRRLMREDRELLQHCSAERLRDEFLRILGGNHADISLRLLDMLDILPYFLPELQALKGVQQTSPHVYDVWNHTLATLGKLGNLLFTLDSSYVPDPASGYSPNLATGLAAMQLGRYRSNITEHIGTVDAAGISHRTLLFFAALYHDTGKPQTQMTDDSGRIRFWDHEKISAHLVSQRAQDFHLSNRDIDLLDTVVRNHMRPIQLNLNDEFPSRRAIYRFFRSCGKAGVDICLLALADYLATYDTLLHQDEWSHFLETIRRLLDAWWGERDLTVSPPPLINGNDLIHLFKLQPGTRIGELLESIREEQAVGEITTREQAIAYVRQRLAVF
jgi:poly(A) polymerase